MTTILEVLYFMVAAFVKLPLRYVKIKELCWNTLTPGPDEVDHHEVRLVALHRFQVPNVEGKTETTTTM